MIPYYAGNLMFKKKRNYFLNNQADFNTVFFGSSRIFRHINSSLLDSILVEKKVQSYNFGCQGAFNPESYFLYENLVEELAKNQLKYAVLEIQNFNFSPANAKTTRGSYWNTLGNLKYGFDYLLHSSYRNSDRLSYLSFCLESFIHSFLDFEIVKNLIGLKQENRSIGQNGFYPLDLELRENPTEKLQQRRQKFTSDTIYLIQQREAGNLPMNYYLEETKKMNAGHHKKLNQLIQLSKKKGINLFVLLPTKMSEKDYLRLLPVWNELPKEHVINMFGYEKYPDLYLSKYAFDRSHLNSSGAARYTTYVADVMNEKILILENSKQK
jgi:hypothetical protein